VANIYVGNLPFTCTEDELRQAFEKFGKVSAVNLIQDRETGRPRGFAFVEMADTNAANQAIEALNLSNLSGRNITVNEAKPREERGGRGGQRRQW